MATDSAAVLERFESVRCELLNRVLDSLTGEQTDETIRDYEVGTQGLLILASLEKYLPVR